MVKNIISRQVLGYSIALTSLLVSSSAVAAGTWYDARNDAMGGAGVAASRYGSAVLANPALMTKAKPEDGVSVILPSVGLQVTDKDKMVDKIDDISNTVDNLRNTINSLTFADLLSGYPELKAAAGDMANKLSDLRGNQVNANGGAALAVTVPNETLPFAFVTKAYGTVHLRSNISEDDITYLRGVSNGTIIPLPGDQDRLLSTGNGLAALVTDYGVAFARQFNVAGHAVSFGITPKMQQVWLYNYTTKIYEFDKSNVRSSEYRNSHTGFNLDVGMATNIGDHLTFGLTGQNLIAQDYDTKEISGYRDTYQIRPLATAGLAWDQGPFTVTGDVDLTPTKRFKSQEDSQYIGVGAEYRLLSWMQLRAGYRADVKGTDENVFTAGVGFSPFNNKVHFDVAGSVGNNNTVGGVVQLAFNF